MAHSFLSIDTRFLFEGQTGFQDPSKEEFSKFQLETNYVQEDLLFATSSWRNKITLHYRSCAQNGKLHEGERIDHDFHKSEWEKMSRSGHGTIQRKMYSLRRMLQKCVF